MNNNKYNNNIFNTNLVKDISKNDKKNFLEMQELKYDSKNVFAQNELAEYKIINDNNFTYNAHDKDKFVHVKPFTNKKGDTLLRLDSSNRNLEIFTGQPSEYIHKKEINSLYKIQPKQENTLMSAATENRYIPSNKNNNGFLPFENNIKVLPGTENKIQTGRNQVYRINLPDIDKLRSKINKKESFKNKPLITSKYGELGTINGDLTKFKHKDFIEKNFTDLLPTKADINMSKITGEYIDMNTNRDLKSIRRTNPSFNPLMGVANGKDSSQYTAPKRSTFKQDPTVGIKNLNPLPTINNKRSVQVGNSSRITSNKEIYGAAKFGNQLYTSLPDKPRETTKEIVLSAKINTHPSKTDNSFNYLRSNDMKIPITDKYLITTEQFKNYNIVPTTMNGRITDGEAPEINSRQQITTYTNNINMSGGSNNKTLHIVNNDKAKHTIRESTNQTDITNSSYVGKGNIIRNRNIMNPTIRESTNQDDITNFNPNSKNNILRNNDKMTTTNRETTSHNKVTNTVFTNKQGRIYNSDNALPTIRESTNQDDVTNANRGGKSNIVRNNDCALPTIKGETLSSKVGFLNNTNNSQYMHNNELLDPTQRELEGKINAVNGEYSSNYVSSFNNPDITIKESGLFNAKVKVTNSQDKSSYILSNDNVLEPTGRELHENKKQIQGMYNPNDGTYVKSNDLHILPTIKESTILTNIKKPLSYTNGQQYVNNGDQAKETIKQTTCVNTKKVSNIKYVISKPHETNSYENYCSNMKREDTGPRRMTNGNNQKYKVYPNYKNVKIRDIPQSVEFYNHPHKPLDYSVTEINEYTQKKEHAPHDFTERIEPSYLEQLKDNDLSLDISVPVYDESIEYCLPEGLGPEALNELSGGADN